MNPAYSSRVLGILALVFGAIAFLFGVVPATAGAAWAFAIVAWDSVLGWIIGIILVLAGLGHAISTAIESAAPDSAVGQSDAAGSPSPYASSAEESASAVGQTITNNKKISFTVNSVTCRIASAGPEFFTETAKGQFCEVEYTIVNNSTVKISLFASDLTGKIGSA